MALGYATKRKAQSDSDEPQPPKRPQTAFFLFSREKRNSLVAQPQFKTKEGKQDTKGITKELGRLWKALDEDEKKQYNDKASELKKKYQEDMEQFKEDNPDWRPAKRQKKGAKATKKAKDPNAPKRPPSGYQIFCSEHRAEVNKRDEVKRENGKLDVTKVMKILSAMWKELSDDEKKPYQQQAAKKKTDYLEEVERYNANKNDDSDEESEEDSEEESD